MQIIGFVITLTNVWADDEVFCDSQDTNKCSILLKSSPSRSQKKNLNDDLKTCPILPGKVTKIEIKKDRMPLGCRIVGGIDMSLVSFHDISSMKFKVY